MSNKTRDFEILNQLYEGNHLEKEELLRAKIIIRMLIVELNSRNKGAL